MLLCVGCWRKVAIFTDGWCSGLGVAVSFRGGFLLGILCWLPRSKNGEPKSPCGQRAQARTGKPGFHFQNPGSDQSQEQANQDRCSGLAIRVTHFHRVFLKLHHHNHHLILLLFLSHQPLANLHQLSPKPRPGLLGAGTGEETEEEDLFQRGGARRACPGTTTVQPLRCTEDPSVANRATRSEDAVQRVRGPVQVGSPFTRI